jgi:Ca-activated chloride channel family protein
MRKAGKPEIVPPLQSGLASVGRDRSPSGPQTPPGGVPADTDNREVGFYDDKGGKKDSVSFQWAENNEYLEGVSKESGSGKVAGKPVENSLTLTYSIAGAPTADPASDGNGKSSSGTVAGPHGSLYVAGRAGDRDGDGLNDYHVYFADQNPDDSKKNRSAESIASPVAADRSEIQRQIARLPAGGSESGRKDAVLAKQEENRDLRKALDSLKRIRENDGREDASARSDGTIGRLEKPLKEREKVVANAPAADSPSAPGEADSATTVTNAFCFSYDPGRDAVSEAPAAEEPKPEVMTGPRFKAEGVNPMVTTVNQPFSTFSIDVDTASYTLSRNYMLKGQLPPAEAVRTEEFVNFFDYDYSPPINKTFGVYIECAPSKFGHGQQLLKIGVKGRRLGREEQRGAVLTILVDTSGSMNTPDRIELAKKSLRMLVEKLAPNDTVTLVQYDNHARVVLEPTQASNRKAILDAIDGLQCNGSTNLEEGMQKAYEMAGANFVPGAENRVLLLSDGAANLGTSSAADILSEVEAFRKQGVFCSVFGMGQGTYNDEMLEALANKGDGVYRFIDSEQEARQVFVDDLAATLNTIARDVKIQIEFNPANVKSYRQLGYENRQLKKEDFRNDAVDAGEVGSGQSVTALYELDLAPRGEAGPDTVCTVRVRYMRTDVKKIEEIEESFRLSQVGRNFDGMDARFKLAACAAETAEILRGSPFAAGSECDDVASVLRPVALELSLDSRVAELLRLASGAKDMARGE